MEKAFRSHMGREVGGDYFESVCFSLASLFDLVLELGCQLFVTDLASIQLAAHLIALRLVLRIGCQTRQRCILLWSRAVSFSLS